MASTVISVQCNKEAEVSLRPLLEKSGVEYVECEMLLKGGPFAAGGVTVLEIVKAISGVHLAQALVAWFKARENRRVHFVIEPGRIEFMAEGMSEKQVQRLIENATDLNIIELPKKNET